MAYIDRQSHARFDGAFHGTRDDDYYRGDNLAERIVGLRGDDDLGGGAGDDRIVGGAGNDLIEGGAGNDTLIGGSGIDAVSYAGSGGEVHVDLAQGYAREFGATVTDDTLSGFEVVIGSNYDDSIIGDAGDNDLRGGGGNDYIAAGRGDDVLRGDGGSDVLNGGDGFDFANYFYAGGAVSVDLAQVISATGADGSDQLVAIEGVYGSAHDDVIAGAAGKNDLYGEGGADRLFGRDGDDFLSGGEGRDVLNGGTGADMLVGGADADRFTFGTGDCGTTLDGADHIADFSHKSGDRIDLRGIDADATTAGNTAFSFIADAAFSGTAGELRYAAGDGFTVLEGDTDGDGAADQFIVLIGDQSLVSSDFLL